ncbi:alpha/beta hydrolase [Hamadaea sp. NPDC051192]|uniref:alpha/beta hydrolase n=1 Tax=Hamadaea sp. NPDC051192 TaxID=3154940 RepID=UPI0034137DD5
MGLLYFGQRKLIYFPSQETGPVPAGMTEVSFGTADGLTLRGWLSEPVGPDRRTAVLVANGNGGNRAGRVPLARALSARGLTVLLFDYRGYGGNPGSPTESGLFLDVRAAYAYLAESFDSQRIVLFGESLGTGVVTDLATEQPARAVVLRSPFTDLASVGAAHYPFLPVRLLLRDRFPVLDKVSAVQAPITVVYGTTDGTVPPAQSVAVAERARVAPIAVQGADHNDAALAEGPQLIDAIDAAAR